MSSPWSTAVESRRSTSDSGRASRSSATEKRPSADAVSSNGTSSFGTVSTRLTIASCSDSGSCTARGRAPESSGRFRASSRAKSGFPSEVS